ncbi:MAG: hypothetical protein ACKOJF_23030, partial [Planctomycetaceae bacterium]
PLGNFTLPHLVQLATAAFEVGSRGQDLFKSEPKRRPIPHLEILLSEQNPTAELQSAVTVGQAIAEGVNLARRLVNLPAEAMYPESFAVEARAIAEASGLAFQV